MKQGDLGFDEKDIIYGGETKHYIICILLSIILICLIVWCWQ